MMRNLLWLSLILILNLSSIPRTHKNVYVATSTVTPTVSAYPIFKGEGTVPIYLRNYYKFAKEIEKEEEVPALLILAVSALESNWDRSYLSTNYNNFFGRKAIGKEPRVSLLTKEFRNGELRTEYANFKAYTTAKESFKDFAWLVNNNKRYKNLKGLALTDIRSWAKELHKAGYATDPHYVRKILSIAHKIKELT